MCQLIFSNLKDKKLNSLAVYTLATKGVSTYNKDGFGLFSTDCGIKKTKIPASCITNLGNFIRNGLVTSAPVIAHIRQSSFKNKNLIDDEHAHPFETEKLVLAHNGTLEFEDWKKNNDVKYKNMIDSQMFLTELNERYTDNLITALQETMLEFDGKFAFLIYDKIKKRFYVIRGSTATLFRDDVILKDSANKNLGFVLDTDKETLEEGILVLNNLIQLTLGFPIEYDSAKITEIEKESIFILDEKGEELIKAGELKETTKAYTTTTYYKNYNAGFMRGDLYSEEEYMDERWWDKGKNKINVAVELTENEKLLTSLMNDWYISL